MRKFLLSAIALSTVATVATPAAAQYYQSRNQGYGQGYGQNYGQGYGYQNGQNIEQQLANLSQRVQRSFERRQISGNEARRLQREIDQVDRLFDRYARNGLTGYERQDLQNRVQNLRQQVRYERQEGRYDRRDDRNDDRRYDRNDRRYDRDDDDD